MIDFEEIYRHQAQAYDRMVSFEDYQGNLERELNRLLPISEKDVLELGAGTGRLTRLLAAKARSVLAVDRSLAMLQVGRQNLTTDGWRGWKLVQADNRKLPVVNGCVDSAVAGWALGHSIEWYPDRWRRIVDVTVAEMRRCLRGEGSILILETLGTGREEPTAPTRGLATYYEFLETDLGFERSWVRTDYRFESPEQGAEATRFFFGDELADRILQERLTLLPECTGFWYWAQ